ncbi:MAG TPA: glutamate 5-kinase [Acidimicrobiia bacterium]|nr:glutamate 5-kinase [Acidimicrobiia bacterium]
MRRPVGPNGRLVVKVGSSSLVRPDGVLDDEAVERIAAEVAMAWDEGYPTVLVSSGAVAAGMSALGMQTRPTDVPGLQVAAAVGQGRLMHRYSEAFSTHGRVAGQILLTRDVLANREQYLFARQAMSRMLAEGVIPVVNENDTVVIDELKLGDNDRLAAIVSHLVSASLLVLLTDTLGLFSSDPRLGEAEFLAAVDHADEVLDQLRGGGGPLGSGGVASKVAAARIAAFSRIPTVVAESRSSLQAIISGDEVGTWVEPRRTSLPARKLWIAFCQPVSGSVTVDDGAARALVGGGRSLLPVGVTAVSGGFGTGATIDIVSASGRTLGRGLARMPAAELKERLGRRGGEEAIHRDDLVVFES